MRVASIETFQLRGSKRQGDYGAPYGCVVKVTTDEGIVGYGETDSLPSVVDAVIRADALDDMMSGLGAVLIGKDADPAAAWNRMAAGTVGYSRDGVVRHAMAAIDIALWDIKGRAEGKPVAELLGGARRDRLRVYATHPLDATLADTTRCAARLVEQGYSAVKFGWQPLGRDVAADDAIVRALREAVGEEVDLLIDGGMAFTVESARERLQRFLPYDLYWLEEPLSPYDIDGYAELREDAPIKIAAGEMAASHAELERLVKNRGVDILQVDVSRTGLTEAMRIAAVAAEHGVACVNHTYSYLLNAAASAHFAAVIEKTDLFECQATPNEIREALNGDQLAPREGWLQVPKGAGLGVEVDEAVLRRFRRAA